MNLPYETFRGLTTAEMLAYLTQDLQDAIEWDQAQGCWVVPNEVGVSNG